MTRSRSSSGRTKRSTARRTRARRRASRPTARPKPTAFKQAAVVGTTAACLKAVGLGRAVGRDALRLARVLRAVERFVRPLEERDRVILRLQLGDARGDVQPAGLPDRPP